MSFQALRGLLSGRASPASPVGGRVEPLLVADQPEAATDAPLPDADVAAAIGHEADAAARVLTAPGGPLEATDEDRRIVAIWSDGRVMVNRMRRGDPAIFDLFARAKEDLGIDRKSTRLNSSP